MPQDPHSDRAGAEDPQGETAPPLAEAVLDEAAEEERCATCGSSGREGFFDIAHSVDMALI